MCLTSNGKSAIRQLHSNWREIIAQKGLAREIVYRMKKLIARLDVVVDKIFIKTVKAHEMLIECCQLTQQLQAELSRHRNMAFKLLTRLEIRVDDLVKKTHEFRVKAG